MGTPRGHLQPQLGPPGGQQSHHRQKLQHHRTVTCKQTDVPSCTQQDTNALHLIQHFPKCYQHLQGLDEAKPGGCTQLGRCSWSTHPGQGLVTSVAESRLYQNVPHPSPAHSSWHLLWKWRLPLPALCRHPRSSQNHIYTCIDICAGGWLRDVLATRTPGVRGSVSSSQRGLCLGATCRGMVPRGVAWSLPCGTARLSPTGTAWCLCCGVAQCHKPQRRQEQHHHNKLPACCQHRDLPQCMPTLVGSAALGWPRPRRGCHYPAHCHSPCCSQ